MAGTTGQAAAKVTLASGSPKVARLAVKIAQETRQTSFITYAAAVKNPHWIPNYVPLTLIIRILGEIGHDPILGELPEMHL